MRVIKGILIAIVGVAVVVGASMLYFVWNVTAVLPPIETYKCKCSSVELKKAIENISKDDPTLRISGWDSVGKHKEKYHFAMISVAHDYHFSMMYLANTSNTILTLNHIRSNGAAVRREELKDRSYIEILEKDFISKIPYCNN